MTRWAYAWGGLAAAVAWRRETRGAVLSSTAAILASLESHARVACSLTAYELVEAPRRAREHD